MTPAMPCNSGGFDFMPKMAMKIYMPGFEPGAFGRALIIKVSPQCRTYTLERGKSISLLFPGHEGDVVANDWCIKIQ